MNPATSNWASHFFAHAKIRIPFPLPHAQPLRSRCPSPLDSARRISERGRLAAPMTPGRSAKAATEDNDDTESRMIPGNCHEEHLSAWGNCHEEHLSARQTRQAQPPKPHIERNSVKGISRAHQETTDVLLG